MSFAKGTNVSRARSRAEIEATLERFGCEGFMSGQDGRTAVIAFKARGRQIMFRMTMPDPDDKAFRLTPTGKDRTQTGTTAAYEQEVRRLWRAMTMSIKAKLVSVEDGIETFEQAFMAHVVMPDGLTISDHVSSRIAVAYETGDMPRLLPGPKRGET